MLLKIDFFAVKARQFTVLLYNGFKISGVVAAIIRCVRPCQFRAFVRFWDGLRAIAVGEDAEPVISIEDVAVRDPDKSMWESFCGKYEHPEDADFIVDEVFMKDGDCVMAKIDTLLLFCIHEMTFLQGRRRDYGQHRFPKQELNME